MKNHWRTANQSTICSSKKKKEEEEEEEEEENFENAQDIRRCVCVWSVVLADCEGFRNFLVKFKF